jgi:hypothetical protein
MRQRKGGALVLELTHECNFLASALGIVAVLADKHGDRISELRSIHTLGEMAHKRLNEQLVEASLANQEKQKAAASVPASGTLPIDNREKGQAIEHAEMGQPSLSEA